VSTHFQSIPLSSGFVDVAFSALSFFFYVLSQNPRQLRLTWETGIQSDGRRQLAVVSVTFQLHLVADREGGGSPNRAAQ
jgi:hypothetical protein